jgi:hypothetical protein
MNDVVFVMVNSRLNKKKQARKGNDYDIDDLASDDEWVADNVEDNLDLDAPIEVGQEDANYGGIGAKEETNENVDHMEDDFHELGLNNINIINRT